MADIFSTLVALQPDASSVERSPAKDDSRFTANLKQGLYADRRMAVTSANQRIVNGLPLIPETALLYRFDSLVGQDVSDVAGNADLTFTDLTPTLEPGRINQALVFNSPEILYAAGSTFLTDLFIGSWTFHMWVKPVAMAIDDPSGNLLTYLGSTPVDGEPMNWLCNIVAYLDPGTPGFFRPYVYWDQLGGDYVYLEWPSMSLALNQYHFLSVRKTVRLDGKVDLDLFVNGVREVSPAAVDSSAGPGEHPILARGLINAIDALGDPARYNLTLGSYTFNGPIIPPEYPAGPDGSLLGSFDDTSVVAGAQTDRAILDFYRRSL
jgi:hypothetical protein